MKPYSITEAVRTHIKKLQQANKKVVFTNGCFDILHIGHVSYLTAARGMGDYLIIAVNSDMSVNRLKGQGRPYNTALDRAGLLDALGCVDQVFIFEEDTPIVLIKSLKPDIYVKGGDYQLDQLPEHPVVKGYGGEVSILPFISGRSTTALLEKINNNSG